MSGAGHCRVRLPVPFRPCLPPVRARAAHFVHRPREASRGAARHKAGRPRAAVVAARVGAVTPAPKAGWSASPGRSVRRPMGAPPSPIGPAGGTGAAPAGAPVPADDPVPADVRAQGDARVETGGEIRAGGRPRAARGVRALASAPGDAPVAVVVARIGERERVATIAGDRRARRSAQDGRPLTANRPPGRAARGSGPTGASRFLIVVGLTARAMHRVPGSPGMAKADRSAVARGARMQAPGPLSSGAVGRWAPAMRHRPASSGATTSAALSPGPLQGSEMAARGPGETSTAPSALVTQAARNARRGIFGSGAAHHSPTVGGPSFRPGATTTAGPPATGVPAVTAAETERAGRAGTLARRAGMAAPMAVETAAPTAMGVTRVGAAPAPVATADRRSSPPGRDGVR